MKKEHEDLLRRAKERFSHAEDGDKFERQEYLTDLAFANGKQWPQDIESNRVNVDPPRPCLVLNKILEKLDQVSGDFRQARPSMKIIPVDSKGDPETAEIFAGIIRHIEYNSSATNTYATAFDCMITGGRGAWRIGVDEKEDGKKEIRIHRVPNPLVFYWDPQSKNQDLSDARYMFFTERVPREDYERKYGKVAPLDDWDASDESDLSWETETEVRLAEYWWRDDEDGKIKSCLLSPSGILDGPHEWPGKYFPFVVCLGKELWVGGKRTNRSMVRPAREPQRLYNYWSSAVTELIALAPTAPWLVTPTMIAKYQQRWDDQARQNYHYLLYDPDPMAPHGPRREMPPMLSTAIAAELARMDHDIMSAMGLYKANLGDDGQEKSGKAILARQREGDTGAYAFTDNFAVALTFSGKVLIDLIPKVYDTEDIIRIRGEDDEDMEVPINAVMNSSELSGLTGKIQGVNSDYKGPLVFDPQKSPYVNDLSVGTYDLRVDIGPSYTTQRQEAAAQLIDIVKTIPQAGLAAIDLIVRNLDLPGGNELAERMKKLVPIGIREPDPGEEMPQQPPDPKIIELQLKERDLVRKEFEATVKAVADLMRAEAAQIGNQVQEMKLVVDQMKMQQQGQQADQQHALAARGQQIEEERGRFSDQLSARDQDIRARQLEAQAQGPVPGQGAPGPGGNL